MQTDGVVDSAVLPAVDEVVAILAATWIRRREDERSFVTCPSEPTQVGRVRPAAGEQPIADPVRGRAGPLEREHIVEAASRRVDIEVYEARWSCPARSEPLSRQTRRCLPRTGWKSCGSAGLKHPLIRTRIAVASCERTLVGVTGGDGGTTRRAPPARRSCGASVLTCGKVARADRSKERKAPAELK